MAMSGRLKYSRLILILNSGCTQLLRAAVLHQVNISNTEETKITLDDYLHSKRSTLFPHDGRRNKNPHDGRRNEKKEEGFEKIVYPGFGRRTDIETWDLQLLAFVALKLIDDPTLKMDINHLKKIRNCLCHSPNGVISDELYESELQVIQIIFQRTLKTLTDEDTVNKLYQRFDALDIESEEILHENSLRSLREWHQYEKVIEMDDKLDGLTEGQRDIKETLYLIFQHLKANGKETLKLPETAVTIGIKNCNLETQNKVSETLVSMFKSKINSHEQLKTDLTEGSRQILYGIISEIAEELAKSGKDIVDAYHGCVVLTFRCSSYEHLQELWNQAMNGSLTQMIGALQNALSEQYPGIQLDVFTTHTEWWRCVNTLIDNLSKYVPLDDINAKIAEQLTTLDISDPFACIQSATVEEPNHLKPDDYTKVNLRIIPRSSGHFQHLSDIHKVDTLRVKLEEASRALSKDIRSDVMIKLVPSEDSNEYDPLRPGVDEELLNELLSSHRIHPKETNIQVNYGNSRLSKSTSQYGVHTDPLSYFSYSEMFPIPLRPIEDQYGMYAELMSALSQLETKLETALKPLRISSPKAAMRTEPISADSQSETALKPLRIPRPIDGQLGMHTELISADSQSKTALKPLRIPRPRDDREKKMTSNRRYVSVRIPQDDMTCSIEDICQLPDRSFVVSDYANTRLKALDQSFCVTSYCDLPASAHGVCYTVNGSVAAALKNRTIQFVSVEDKLALTRSFPVTFDCRGVAYCQDQLYICALIFDKVATRLENLHTAAVFIYSLNGSQLRVFDSDKNGKPIFKSPWYIAASPSAVFVADFAKGLITLDSNGHVLSIFNPPDLISPTGVCFAYDDNVFVAGHWSHNVILVGNKGISKVGDVVKGRGKIQYPNGLFFDIKDHILIVSQTISDSLAVIDIARNAEKGSIVKK